MTDGNIDTAEPLVWLVEPYRAGERGQVLALAKALGWPFVLQNLEYRHLAARTNLLRGSDLSGLRSVSRNSLLAPWPDLLITAGMRNEPVCRWIRDRSGGHTRIVHVGRPWADPQRFDLVITTPQYRLPVRDNVLHNGLTMHSIDPERLIAAAKAWRPRLDGLAPPYLSVVLGGDSGPFTFGPKAAVRLVAQVNTLAEKMAASVLVTSSARTSVTALAVLEAGLTRSCQVYNWRAGDADNPYYAYLGLADQLVVTGDSISMLSEACATRRPVHIFDCNTGSQAMRAGFTNSGQNDFRVTAYLYRALMQWGPQRLSRDISLIHKRLLAESRACWLGEDPQSLAPRLTEDLENAVVRVRALFNV